MLKTIPSDSYDFGEPAVEAIKISSRGLRGNDLQEFIKRAGHAFADILDRVPLKEGERPVHMLAVGATETYGANRKADGFPKLACVTYHPTFTKFARYYRDHDSSDPLKSYGRVIASTFNDEMQRIELIAALNGNEKAASANNGLVADVEQELLDKGKPFSTSMGCKVAHDRCFTAESRIDTPEGELAIEHMRVGFLVRTHKGRSRVVTRIMKSQYRGSLYSFDVMGMLTPQQMTANHPVLVLQRETLKACLGTVKGAKRRHTFGTTTQTCTTCKAVVPLEPDWASASALRIGDYVTYPIERPGRLAVREAYAYLLGLYAGDGCVLRRRSGRRKQGEQKIVGIAITLDAAHPKVIAKAKAAAEEVHGRPQSSTGSGDGKNSVVINIYNQDLGEFCYKHAGQYSCAKRFSSEVFDFDREARLQVLAGLIDSDGAVDYKHRVGCSRITLSNYYLARQSQRLFWGLELFASMHEEDRGESGFSGSNPGKIYVVGCGRHVTSVIGSRSAKASNVVSGKQTWCAAVFSGGYIYLPICGIHRKYVRNRTVYNFSVDEDETYIAGFVVHNCSGCNHLAAKREEYCDEFTCKYGGLKKYAGKTFEDGHQLHAVNDHPLFYDISGVFRNADRIAFALGDLRKTAGMADSVDIEPPAWQFVENVPEVVARQRDILRSLVAMEAQMPAKWAGDASMVKRASAHFSLPPSWRARQDVWSALAGSSNYLPLDDWMRLTAGNGPETEAAIKLASDALPGVYSRLAKSPLVLDKLATNAYTVTDRPVSSRLKTWSEALALDFSLRAEEMRKRAWAGAVGEKSPSFAMSKAASTSSSGDAIAEQYALYTIGFLEGLRRSGDPDPAATCTFVLRRSFVN